MKRFVHAGEHKAAESPTHANMPSVFMGRTEESVLTCADETGASAVDQVVVVGQDERTALLDLQAVLVARYLLLTGLLGGGEILST